MHLAERLWATVTSLLSIVTLSPLPDSPEAQHPLQIHAELVPIAEVNDPSALIEPVEVHVPLADIPVAEIETGPSFHPPGHSSNDKFQCHYPDMVGWEPCSTPENRQCWLRNKVTWEQYDLYTNYEEYAPVGITRYYEMNLTNGTYDADGENFPYAKLFNNTYPGPWVEACWGDTVIVNVTNHLPNNGTSVHWHGIRQNQTVHMDGVNGVTQCPIAPKDYFVYKFNVTQYGSSWYHSHYSVQYADGAVGPLTFYGPSSAPYDEAINPPLIMTDWGHNSAFTAVHTKNLGHKDILLNGKGNVTNFNNQTNATTDIAHPYHITFEKPQFGKPIKKYLLRIINTSFDTTFIFSIDHHKLRIVSADFVPIHSYSNTSVLVGIGQRYNVIVEANPIAYGGSGLPKDDLNFWMRTYIALCNLNTEGTEHYERTGILRYDATSDANPTTEPWAGIAKSCSDESYVDLHPILPWQVANPANGPQGEVFDMWLNTSAPRPYPLAIWTMDTPNLWTPMRVDYADPTFLHLDHKGDWPAAWRMVPEDYTKKDWVYLVISRPTSGKYGAHPIHLHGHDFALLQQSHVRFDPSNVNLKLDNPPRRDVVLLPSDGYIVIAFKADNPGPWLVHCHIAFHISEGLGMQIMERQGDAEKIWHKGDSKAINETERVCANWREWQGNTTNWAIKPENCTQENKQICFQDDSGV